MDGAVVLAAAGGVGLGLVATTYGFGLRHGVDWDHIAAITDVTGSGDTPRRSMFYATLYAAGHALVVLALGTLAIVAGDVVPDSVDAAMERVVGVTLVLLGLYVFVALARQRRGFRMRSRWMLVFSGVARVVRWVRGRRGGAGAGAVVEFDHDHAHDHGHGHHHHHGEARPAGPPGERAAAGAGAAPAAKGTATAVGHRHRHRHRHTGPLPEDPFETYGPFTSLAVGMIHGVGAETPTQVLLFLAAAQAGGTGAGLLLLGVFTAGLLTSNTAIALASTYGFLSASRSFAVYAAVAVVTGAFSLALGILLLVGRGGVLPAILAG